MSGIKSRCILEFAIVVLTSAVAARAQDTLIVDVEKYTAPIRVACVGDSITEGFGAGRGNAWPIQLGKVLGPKWDVKNFGVSGTTLMNSGDSPFQKQGKFQGAKSFNPNVVVIMLGTNDTKLQNWNKFKKDFEADYKDMIKQFAELPAKPRIFICRPPYIAADGSWGINDPSTVAEIPVIDKVAKELNLGIVDVHAALKGKDALIPDKVHPNAQGQTVIARAVLKALTGYEGDFPPTVAVVPTSEKEGIAWRYTTEKPAEDWFKADFDMSSWKEGPGGFGNNAPAAGPARTEWNTSDIWIRREFMLGDKKLNNPRLWMRHDDNAEVYLNGVLAVKAGRFSESYRDFDIRPEATVALKPGRNIISVHCHQIAGGQYIDAGLIDVLPVTSPAKN